MENKQNIFEQQPVVREPGLLDARQQPANAVPVKETKFRWTRLVLIVAFIVIIVGIFFVFRKSSNNTIEDSSAKTQDINLNGVSSPATTFTVKDKDRVEINGQLQANEGIVLSPITEPTIAVIGQIYIDKNTGQLRYYNGTEYVTVISSGAGANYLTETEILNLIVGFGPPTILPQDLSSTGNPTFAGLTISGGGTFGNLSVTSGATAGSLSVTNNAAISGNLTIGNTTLQNGSGSVIAFTLPATDGSASQCLTTNGSGVLSFSSCSTGAGTAFVQGGNAFSATGTLGTTDGNDLDIITNSTVVATFGSGGGIVFQNPTNMVNAFRVNDDSGTAVLAVNNTWGTLGAVGIGTSGPTAKLSVIGIGNATGDALWISNSTSTGEIARFSDNLTDVFSLYDGGAATFQNSTDSTTGFQVQDADGGTPILNVDTTNERVGIGNAAPTVALDVTGAGKFSSTLEVDDYVAIGNNSTPSSVATLSIGNIFDSTDVCVFGCYGLFSSVGANSPTTPNSLTAYYAKASTSAVAFTLGASYGLYVDSASLGAGSTITNNYGINVAAQTAGTDDYGVAIGAADTQTLWLSSNADNTTAAAGIAFGASRDTNLYRSAANTLKTDDVLIVGSNLTVQGSTIDLSNGAKTVSLNNVADALNFDTNTFSIDALNNRVGIGNAAPTEKLTVANGTIRQEIDTNYTLSILDSLSDTDHAELIGAQDIFATGDYLYVINDTQSRFNVIDISNPSNLVRLGGFQDTTNLANCKEIEVRGRYAYVICATSGSNGDRITMIDISNPSSPVYAGSLRDAVNFNNAKGFDVAGQYAYVVSEDNNSLSVVDVSNPNSIKVVGTIVDGTDLNEPKGVDVQGDYAYVTSIIGDSLTVVDISNPYKPTIKGSVSNSTTLNYANKVQVRGKYAYVAALLGDRLTIVDVSDPATPVIKSNIYDATNLDDIQSIEIVGEYVFAASATPDRVTVIDVSDPSLPTIVDSLEDTTVFNNIQGFTVSGRYVYFASDGAGADGHVGSIELPGIVGLTADIGTLRVTNVIIDKNIYVSQASTFNSGITVNAGGISVQGDSAIMGKLSLGGVNVTADAWGANGIQMQVAGSTFTDNSTAASGTATNAVFNSFAAPTLAATNTSVTTTNAATVYIQGAPTAGTNQTITNAYALWVDAGTTRLDDQLMFSGVATDITSNTNEDLTIVANGTGVIYLNDTVQVGTLAAYDVDDSYAVCREASTKKLTACDPSTNEPPFLHTGNSYGADLTLGTNDAYSLNFETSGTTRWLINTSGHFLPNADDAYDLGSSSLAIDELYLGDGGGLVLGLDQDATLAYDETGDDRVELSGINASLFIEDRLGLGKQAFSTASGGVGTETLTPTSSFVAVTVTDDGDTFQISESSAKDGDILVIMNVDATATDTINIDEVTGGSTDTFLTSDPVALDQGDSITLMYSVDLSAWVQISLSDN